MEKYGVMADNVECPECEGVGRKKYGRRQWRFCDACKGTGRKHGLPPNPEKEAMELNKQLGKRND